MSENIFPSTNLYLPLHFHGFEAKKKNSVCSIIRDVSFQKQLQQTSPPPGESILLEFCQNVSNR